MQEYHTCTLVKTTTLNTKYVVLGYSDGHIAIRDTSDITKTIAYMNLGKGKVLDAEMIIGQKGCLFVLTDKMLVVMQLNWIREQLFHQNEVIY